MKLNKMSSIPYSSFETLNLFLVSLALNTCMNYKVFAEQATSASLIL